MTRSIQITGYFCSIIHVAVSQGIAGLSGSSGVLAALLQFSYASHCQTTRISNRPTVISVLRLQCQLVRLCFKPFLVA